MSNSSTSTPTALVRWLEDETFYSLCCRQHCFLGNLDTSSTLAWLFGAKCYAMAHDFPCNLSSLKSPAAACWGSPLSIIQEHTLLPMFCPFQSEERIQAAIKTMASPNLGAMKYSLGLLTGRFGAEHPLKACPICITEDRATHGVAYWHLSHQYPGITFCPVHGSLIRESTVNRQWSGTFRWALPSENHVIKGTVSPPTATVERTLKRLGAAALELASYGHSAHFSPDSVRTVYKEAMHQLCVVPAEQVEAEASLAEFMLPLQPYFPLSTLPTTPQKAAAFIAHMTRKPRSRYHPLKHLLFITWLFGGLRPFMNALDRLEDAPQDMTSVNTQISNAPVEQSSIGNVVAHATIPSKTPKPKKLIPQIRKSILNCLQNGDSKNYICSKYRVSICTVNRLLRAEPLIQSARTKKQQKTSIRMRRAEWTRITNANPDAGPKEIRSLSPKTYHWLYRNDKDWFLEKIRQMPSGRRGNYVNINWADRDRELCNLVSDILLKNYDTSARKVLRRSDIFTLIPTLSRSLENRDRYPETRCLLKNILDGNVSLTELI
ncbi:UNVERIFIED_ORG: hypothetical protein J2Y76_005184 [Pseudomonas reinekei]|uniref:TnsD family Tn7-like transposition protein n=1 Tax=Pseudomonas laurylsulfatiphila TaxID=2011015 RepID=UPI003D2136B6|nr:hypothetical protein [Pseudomonas reinekei]